jgi:thiamine kinase-like enzyme
MCDCLCLVTRRTAADPLPGEIELKFVQPLRVLSQYSALSQAERNAAKEALSELETGRWHPRLVLEHNDLWSGNFLKASPDDQHDWPFVIIDWGGSQLAGHGIYDLVRLSIDFHISPSQFASQLKIHCDALKCEPSQARYYLLSALGTIADNLGYFPVDRFVGTVRGCMEYLSASS